jgi:cytidine deaminase
MSPPAAQPLASMIAAARQVRQRAWVPYSKFKVGAALRTPDGRIFAGCNVENAAYPQSSCAEASAISAMVSAGARRIAEVVVVGGGTGPCTPCGGCRQRLAEFAAPTTKVHMVSPAGRVLLSTTLAALLPHAFGPINLR